MLPVPAFFPILVDLGHYCAASGLLVLAHVQPESTPEVSLGCNVQKSWMMVAPCDVLVRGDLSTKTRRWYRKNEKKKVSASPSRSSTHTMVRLFEGVLVKSTPSTMAVIEHINETKDFITYRINDELVLCKAKVKDFLEKEVREVHEKNEKVTKETIQWSTREKA
eukprot:Gregarina_sp_Poly_1__202@NODE_1047_length_5252_cov_120_237030_g727_i0_p3_GENE_NODE_1047_length_5252_cov_120_237030_g727_i0NODE_1047_length_5252_cov_120_237030_g727_i0_p3_ORF_typecomplete_len165_score17_45Tfb5/PF06331_12/2_6e13NTPase_P4/PF11602_8/0_029_NODE_1047_length_5252_cov_120_237030_g727_i030633557